MLTDKEAALVPEPKLKGLGYCVDATRSNPRSSRRTELRIPEVVNRRKNFVVREDGKCRTKYWKVYSRDSYKAALSAGIPSNLPLTLLGDMSISATNTDITTAYGMVEITASIEFEDPQYSESETDVINDLYYRLFQLVPSEHEEVRRCVENYAEEKKELFIREAYQYIKEKKLTHYISSITLGKVIYGESSLRESEIKTNVSGAANVHGFAEFKASLEKLKENGIITGEVHTSDPVIDYDIKPLSDLLFDKNMKDILSTAIELYVKNQEGTNKYRIKCKAFEDDSQEFYVAVRRKNLCTVTKEQEATFFNVQSHNDCFYITHGALSVTCVTVGTIFEVNNKRPSMFILRDPMLPEDVPFEEWLGGGLCCIKMETKFPLKYLGLNSNGGISLVQFDYRARFMLDEVEQQISTIIVLEHDKRKSVKEGDEVHIKFYSEPAGFELERDSAILTKVTKEDPPEHEIYYHGSMAEVIIPKVTVQDEGKYMVTCMSVSETFELIVTE